MSSLLSLFIGLAIALLSYRIGQDIAQLAALGASKINFSNRNKKSVDATNLADERNLGNSSNNSNEVLPPKLSSTVALTLSTVFLLILLTTLITILSLDNDDTRRYYFLSALLAPVGATIRWQFSSLNLKFPNFPLGTFIVNIAAVLINLVIGAVLIVKRQDLQRRWVLRAVITGIAGSLSTVSTWIDEIWKMEKKYQWRYIVLSLGISQVLGILVFCITYWVRS